jgi:hypothetical protein
MIVVNILIYSHIANISMMIVANILMCSLHSEYIDDDCCKYFNIFTHSEYIDDYCIYSLHSEYIDDDYCIYYIVNISMMIVVNILIYSHIVNILMMIILYIHYIVDKYSLRSEYIDGVYCIYFNRYYLISTLYGLNSICYGLWTT